MIDQFINYYNKKIKKMQGVRAGGRLRALKGELVEVLAESMIIKAWENIGGAPKRIKMDKHKYDITDNKEHTYGLSQDKQVYIDEQFILSIECKAYAEVAMYKRILVDAYLLRTKFPNLTFCLFQLESMLGGDYSEKPDHPKGSNSVYVLDYHFPNLNSEILTLLDGERNIKKPIHKKRFYKPMVDKRVKYALNYFEEVLRKYV